MVHTETPNWHAVHTRSRHEKAVDVALAERDIETFLPLVRVPSARRDRRAEYDMPLFPGYLFVHIPHERGWEVKRTKGVARLLGPRPLEYSIVPEQQIESIRTLVNSQLRLDPFPCLTVGRMVRVTRGLLKGAEGRLIERRGAIRLLVAIDLLGKAVTADIRADDVEPM